MLVLTRLTGSNEGMETAKSADYQRLEVIRTEAPDTQPMKIGQLL